MCVCMCVYVCVSVSVFVSVSVSVCAIRSFDSSPAGTDSVADAARLVTQIMHSLNLSHPDVVMQSDSSSCILFARGIVTAASAGLIDASIALEKTCHIMLRVYRLLCNTYPADRLFCVQVQSSQT